jgi:serine/threonine-protein kinase HipA
MATIMPRHFLESAQRAGMPAREVESIFRELRETAPAAIANVQKSLPNEIPRDLSESIIGGIEQRLRLLDLGEHDERRPVHHDHGDLAITVRPKP